MKLKINTEQLDRPVSMSIVSTTNKFYESNE